MADSSSEPNWFPTPAPKPLQAPSAAKVGLGVLVVVFAVAAGGVALSSAGHSSHKAAATPTTSTTRVLTAPSAEDRRQAFDDCMKSMGAGSPAPRSRFGGGGPSQHFRDAFGVCRSLLQTGALDPVNPGGTGKTVSPAA